MIIIAKDAETKLLKELRNCRSSDPSQRFFFLEFSGIKMDYKELFSSFLKILQDVPQSYLAHIYICQDYDVCIVIRGFMQRHFADLVKKLAEDLHRPEILTLAKAFEIRRNCEELEQIVLHKIDALEQVARKKEKTESEKKTLDALANLDAEAISTISARRGRRRDAKVMVVDDDQLTRTLVHNVLSKDYQVCMAQDGRQALAEYVASAPDILFLDIGLPDISGHQVLESLFQIDPEAHVIMLSGRKDKENILQSMRLGACGFIGKPFTRAKLFQHIRKSPFVHAKEEAGKPGPQKTRSA